MAYRGPNAASPRSAVLTEKKRRPSIEALQHELEALGDDEGLAALAERLAELRREVDGDARATIWQAVEREIAIEKGAGR